MQRQNLASADVNAGTKNAAVKGAEVRTEADLEARVISTSDGVIYGFDVCPVTEHCLLKWLDDIGLTLANASSIHTFEASAAQAHPWVRGPMGFGDNTHNI